MGNLLSTKQTVGNSSSSTTSSTLSLVPSPEQFGGRPDNVSKEECKKLSELIGATNTSKLVPACDRRNRMLNKTTTISDKECARLLGVLLKGLGNIDAANEHLPKSCGSYIGSGRVV